MGFQENEIHAFLHLEPYKLNSDIKEELNILKCVANRRQHYKVGTIHIYQVIISKPMEYGKNPKITKKVKCLRNPQKGGIRYKALSFVSKEMIGREHEAQQSPSRCET